MLLAGIWQKVLPAKKWGAIALGGLAGWVATALALTKPLQNMEKGVIDKFGAQVIKPQKPTNV